MAATKPLKKEQMSDENQKVNELAQLLATATSVFTIVEDVIPKMNKLVEDNIMVISESFSKIAASTKTLSKNNASEELKPVFEEIEKGLGSAIMGLQFQDRLSQNLVILNNIAQVLNVASKDVVNLQASKNASNSTAVNIDLSKKILENLKLGEIREVFVNYLISSGLIKDGSEIGYNPVVCEVQSQDVDLF